jgi:hypothetical protein
MTVETYFRARLGWQRGVAWRDAVLWFDFHGRVVRTFLLGHIFRIWA